MIKVAICDDEKLWRDKAEEILKRYASDFSIEMNIELFRGKQELLTYEGIPLEVIFMDIDLGNETGIEAVEEINKKWPSSQVVYLTSYLNYATEVYSTKHSYYVLKDQFEKRLPEIFLKVLKERERRGSRILFNLIGKSSAVLSPMDIYYFERDKRVTRIVTVWGNFEIKDKLEDVQRRLSDIEFLRCHNSYIVYLPAVREMESNDFIMENGDRIPISRNYAPNAKKAFMNWALTNMS